MTKLNLNIQKHCIIYFKIEIKELTFLLFKNTIHLQVIAVDCRCDDNKQWRTQNGWSSQTCQL